MLETIQSAVEMATTASASDTRKKNIVVAVNLSIGCSDLTIGTRQIPSPRQMSCLPTVMNNVFDRSLGAESMQKQKKFFDQIMLSLILHYKI